MNSAEGNGGKYNQEYNTPFNYFIGDFEIRHCRHELHEDQV